ncbi:DNA polymerase III subunit delta' [Arcobacter sp. FWKO B]|uniref:DNA polymerase III subunit delta' n=1 Tax=Arcobacter sp. FWKO B TaxID=2593672 RepID=UPI0018A50D01|nr:DNA polymerase III subunit delta' [Arcobacter sp. FWKO B]QOG11306.1 DNA polymerase III subunit delta' [Arcobacter sp. FWKO B]
MQINSNIIFVCNDIDEFLDSLVPTLPKHFTRIIRNEDKSKDEFLIAHSQLAIKEAYLASNETKYILLCGTFFRKEAQNSLLKILEESPKNILFILITTSKTSLLPTIMSRMSYRYLKTKKTIPDFPMDLNKITIKEIYEFLKQNQRISKPDAKNLIETIFYKATKQKIKFTEKELETFSNASKLVELNSRPVNILSVILLTILHKRKK